MGKRNSKRGWVGTLYTLEKEAGKFCVRLTKQADGLVETLSKADFLPNKNYLIKEAKRNLKSLLTKVEKTNVGAIAKNMAKTNSTKILSMLNFPTKKEVAKLNARLSQLEKKFRGLSHRAGA